MTLAFCFHLLVPALLFRSVQCFQNTLPIRSTFKSPALKASHDYIDLLSDLEFTSALDERKVGFKSLVADRSEKITIFAFLTHFADFNAWEYAQKLKHYLPAFDRVNSEVELVAVGLGTIKSAKIFADFLSFPLNQLYVDESGEAYKKLGFSRGFDPPFKLNPYIRLLAMLTGIGSPGTLQAVLKGYRGDRTADASWIDSSLELLDRRKFDAVGKEGARPFEVATLRLQNMKKIVQNWSDLSPADKDLITWQGGTIVFKGNSAIYSYKDKGILTYTPIEEVLKAIGSEESSVK